MELVILGNGIAGMEAALAARRVDAQARITLVSDEHDHLFSRPALMYLFCGQLDLKGAEPYERDHYERFRLQRARGSVAALDAGQRALLFTDGRRLPYDRLLLAVGSVARPAPWPGSSGPGVHAFVTLRDLHSLDREARPGMRAAVVGGGLIGVEVAEVLLRRGLSVSFVVKDRWYYPTALDAEEAKLVGEHLRAHGCDVRLPASVTELVRAPSGALTGARLDSGELLGCELVVSCLGVVPNTGFLRQGPLSLSEGGAIEVGDQLETSLPDVWAAGDCANVTWVDGRRRPELLWYTARDQGRVAGANLLGGGQRYRRGRWYNSAKFFDVEWTQAGWVPPSIDERGEPAAPVPGVRSWFQRSGPLASQRIVERDSKVVGFNLLGSRWNHEPLLEWIEQGKPLSWALEHLSEAQFDEELEPRFRVR